MYHFIDKSNYLWFLNGENQMVKLLQVDEIVGIYHKIYVDVIANGKPYKVYCDKIYSLDDVKVYAGRYLIGSDCYSNYYTLKMEVLGSTIILSNEDNYVFARFGNKDINNRKIKKVFCAKYESP